jgi:hypothetical protein
VVRFSPFVWRPGSLVEGAFHGKADRWQSEKCDKVLNEISNAINECRQPVAMVFVSKLLSGCPSLVLVLFGYCVRINGEGKDLLLSEEFKYFETKSPQTSQKHEM